LKKSISPAKHLIEKLTKKQSVVTDDTILLINQAEVLAKDGIHGKIAQVGVGFGTGRHLSLRKSNEKIRSQEQSPIKETVAIREGAENIYK